MAQARVLLVDSKASIRRGWARALFDGGIDVATAEAIEAAPGLVHGRSPTVLLAAADMLGSSAARVEELVARSTVIALADPLGAGDTARALRGRVFAVVDRVDTPPPGLVVLVDSARAIADAAKPTASTERVAAPELVAASRAMRSLVARAASLADSGQSLLILGDEGTGKRSLARLCHAKGRRASRPLVVVDFSALEQDEIAATLGEAVDTAGNGTLVLHRVDALTPAAQSIVLAQSPNARVIATALPSLRESERSGAFRRELYYRLASKILDVPPLSDRPDDIPVLAYTFARRVTEQLGLAPRRFSAEALRALRNAPWEGNIPELEARTRAAIAGSTREVLALGDLGFNRPGGRKTAMADVPYAAARSAALGDFEHGYVEAVLAHAGGSLARAADLAGIDRANFRRLVRRVRGKS